MWQFIDVFKRVKTSNNVQDDDFADRLSHRHTVAVLILFTVLVSSSQFVGNPIGCWCPAHFTGAMVQYTNYICWISNTYYVASNQYLPNPEQAREFKLAYYQWVPFILALMAFLFYLPHVFWHFMAKPSGLDAKTVMKAVATMNTGNTASREKFVALMDRAFDYHRDYYDTTFLGRLRRKINRFLLPQGRSGAYITALYMVCKLLYLVNVCGQFFLLNSFMGDNFNIFGFQLIRDAVSGKDMWESSRFPRVTMCDFSIRTLADNMQTNTIQCVLQINLYNEKIFAFIWFWMCIVAALSVYSCITWIMNFCSPSRFSFVRRYIKIRQGLDAPNNWSSTASTSSMDPDPKIFHAFMDEYLKQDGVFLLRIIKKNSNDIMVGELVCALWDHFNKKFKASPKFQTLPRNGENDHGLPYPKDNQEKLPIYPSFAQ